MTDIPDPWATAMVNRRFVDPRYDDPRPSLRQLAEAVNIHTTTLSNIVKGRTKPSPATVAAVAQALRLDPVTVAGWVNQARSVSTPYEPPAEVDQLTEREQAAITELIRAIAAGKQGEGHERAAASTRAGVSPAQLEWDRNAEALRLGGRGRRRLSEREVVATLGPRPAGEVDPTPTGEVAGQEHKGRRRA